MSLGKWCIFYGHRTEAGEFFTYDHRNDPYQAPGWGVQVVRYVDVRGKVCTLEQSGRYAYHPEYGTWCGHDGDGIAQYYINVMGHQKVILGTCMLKDDEWNEVKVQAAKWKPE